MPRQNPLTRLLQVSTGLAALAEELNRETGIDPTNIRYWSRELADIHEEIERLYQARPVPRRAEDAQ
jgi:hypothetical protein